jgi:hypothetical protein
MLIPPRGFFAISFFALAALCPPTLARAEVPELAKIKAAAEAGDPEAQFTFAKSFGALSSEWRRWLTESADQGYGPAEDELAWTPQGFNFSIPYTEPKQRAYHLNSNKPNIKEALLRASSAADKGFRRSRMLLAHAYANGYFVPTDRVEAYKWVTLAGGDDLFAGITSSGLKSTLVKIMPLSDVQAGEALAKTYQPGKTVMQVRNAVIIPNLKLTGLASTGTERIAIINGTRFVAGKNVQLNIDGLSVSVRCVSVDEKAAVISLPPDNKPITLRQGIAAVVSP